MRREIMVPLSVEPDSPGGQAQIDQLQAQAIDLLRGSTAFVLVVGKLNEDDEFTATVAMAASASIAHMLLMVKTMQDAGAQIAGAVVKRALADAMDDGRPEAA